jgi:hypothetical protein
MKITLADINIYKEIVNKIDTLVQAYYEEFIKCNDTYELHRWEINDDNTIRIIYSCIDYLDESWNDDTTITLDELNGVIEEDKIDDLIIEPEDDFDNLKCACGGEFIFDNVILTSLPPQYPYTCNKCGKKIIMRSDRIFYEPGMKPLTGDIYLSDTISINDCDPREVKCVLTNNGIDTNTITNC